MNIALLEPDPYVEETVSEILAKSFPGATIFAFQDAISFLESRESRAYEMIITERRIALHLPAPEMARMIEKYSQLEFIWDQNAGGDRLVSYLRLHSFNGLIIIHTTTFMTDPEFGKEVVHCPEHIFCEKITDYLALARVLATAAVI